MPDLEFTPVEAYGQLLSWTTTLLNKAKSRQEEVLGSLDPSTKLPANCRSHASLSLTIFNGVKEALSEVVAGVERVEDAIRRSGTR